MLKRIKASILSYLIYVCAFFLTLIYISIQLFAYYRVMVVRKICLYHARHYYQDIPRILAAPSKKNPNPVPLTPYAFLLAHENIVRRTSEYAIYNVKCYKCGHVTIHFDAATQMITYYYHSTIKKRESYTSFMTHMAKIKLNPNYDFKNNPLLNT